MAAEPTLGQLDPEDQDSEEEELDVGLVGETPKHFAIQVGCGTGAGGRGVRSLGEVGGQRWSPAKSTCPFQVVDMLALYLPPEKLCPLLVSVVLSFQCSYPWVCLVS